MRIYDFLLFKLGQKTAYLCEYVLLRRVRCNRPSGATKHYNSAQEKFHTCLGPPNPMRSKASMGEQ